MPKQLKWVGADSTVSLLFMTVVISAATYFFVTYSDHLENGKTHFPDHAIRYVLHVSPGGATDVLARLIAKPMSKELKVPITVENRPGGGGANELQTLNSSRPDGYTIGSVTASHIGRFHTTLKQYNIHSVSWIARLALDPFVLVVPTDSQFKTLKELMSYSKNHPNAVSVGSFGGTGSASNIAWNILASKGDAQANWVPYKSVGDAVTAALGHHIDVAIAYADLVKQYVRANKLRALAVLTSKRLPALPSIPTMAQAGYSSDADWEQFRGIIAPKGVPNNIKGILSRAALKAMRTKPVQEYLEKNDLVDGSMNYKKFAKYANDSNALTVHWLIKLHLLK